MANVSSRCSGWVRRSAETISAASVMLKLLKNFGSDGLVRHFLICHPSSSGSIRYVCLWLNQGSDFSHVSHCSRGPHR